MTASAQPPVRSIPSARAGDLSVQIGRHPLVHEIAVALGGKCGVKPGARVVVAVSGGADSTALLLACAALSERTAERAEATSFVAAHVHHHLRESADDDLRFVRELCADLSFPLRIKHVHPGRETGNVMAAARRLRYRALAEAACEFGADIVATAHHAEDQLETMIMALCRGAGAERLGGMRWSRRLIGDVRLVRPMLAIRKSSCEELCRAAGVQWREDPSNQDVSRARARLRADVLPTLNSLWPDAAAHAVESAQTIAAMIDLCHAHLDEDLACGSAPVWSRDSLAKQPGPLLAMGLRRAAVRTAHGQTREISMRQIRRAAAAISDDVRRPREFAVAAGVVIRVTARDVSIVDAGDSA